MGLSNDIDILYPPADLEKKKHKLKRLVQSPNSFFMSADFLSKSLDKLGYCVTTMHGKKSQEVREISLEGFRKRRFTILVATDVAGRGIDIADVAHVINFDMPEKIETYTHRIGRTGRAGKRGLATTFLTLQDSDVFYDLKQTLSQRNSLVPPELARHEASKFKPGTLLYRHPKAQ